MSALRMLSKTRLLLAVSAFVLLAGCASTGSSSLAANPGSQGNDSDYMYVVERTARQKGVRVVWINPPPEEGEDYIRYLQ